MQNINYWKQFEHTGKIEDYLNYKNSVTSLGEGVTTKESEGEANKNPYAGIRMCDRNHIETNSHRGI